MQIDFGVKTQANAYAEGYQDALRDISLARSKDGDEGVAEWLANNLRGVKERIAQLEQEAGLSS